MVPIAVPRLSRAASWGTIQQIHGLPTGLVVEVLPAFIALDRNSRRENMGSDTLMKCTHPPCQCRVEAEQQFCTSSCASARGSARVPCMCGHPGCDGEQRLGEEDDPLAAE
jgi:hypothetical protein